MATIKATYPGLFKANLYAPIQKAKYHVSDMNRFLIGGIKEGDVVIKDRVDNSVDVERWEVAQAKRFTVVKFYKHHVLLRSEYGYHTSVSYFDLAENYRKKGKRQ